MVLQLLSMDLDSRKRRLVVGRRLQLLQMAWSSGPAPPVSAPTASLLVVPAPVSASLPPAKANANPAARQDDTHSTERNSDTNAAATGTPHADSNTNTNYWRSAWSFANADTDIHRRSAWSSADSDTKVHRRSN
jgi:hypothetical protein